MVDKYSKRGAGRHLRGPRRGRAAEVGRHLPPAPGRRRVHAAHQGARAAQLTRRPGARDRGGGRRLRRGPRRQPGLRQPLRRHHHPPGHPAALDPHRGRAPHLAAALGGRAHHAAGLRRLGPQRVLVPGLGRRRRRGRRRATRSPRPISDFFTGNREYANLPRKFKIGVTGCREDCATDRDQRHRPVAGPRRGRHASASTCWSAAGSPTASGWRRTSTCSCGPTRPSSCAGPSPSSSASSATGRTGAWPACATWSRSSGPRASGPRWTSGPASRSRPAGTRAHHRLPGRPRRRPPPAAATACSTSAARSRSGGCAASS